MGSSSGKVTSGAGAALEASGSASTAEPLADIVPTGPTLNSEIPAPDGVNAPKPAAGADWAARRNTLRIASRSWHLLVMRARTIGVDERDCQLRFRGWRA